MHKKGLAQREEGEATPTTTVGILLLSYMVETLPHRFFDCHVWSPDRLKVNSKCRLILFLANLGTRYFLHILAQVMLKFTEKSGMTFAKNRTYRAPQICRNGNESTLRKNT